MKKNFIYGLFAMAALLFATSCQNEDLFGGAQSGDMETVSFSVSTPELSTRAGEGNEIAKLYVGVYEIAKDGQLSEPLAASTLDGSIPVVTGKANVRLELAKNKKYSVIFWAETENNGDAIFDMNWNNRTMTLKNSLKANQEKYDAFWAQKDVVLTGATAEEVVLNRPFAQLNIGTSDKQIAADAGIEVTQSQVVVETPSVFSLQDGSVSTTKSVSYEMSDIYTGPFPVGGNEYLSLNYLLVGADEKALVDVAFSYKDAEDPDAYKLNFSSIPVQRNYRTNIYGTLLTNAADYTVTIDANFGNNDEDATDVVYVTSAEELNAALQADKEEIKIVLLNDVTINGGTTCDFGSDKTQQITIQANDASNLRSASGKTTLTFKDSYRTYVGMENPEGKMIFKNIDIVRETTGGTHWHDNNMKFTSNTEFTNVNFNKGICLDNAKTFTLTNCSINKGKVATYGMFITAGCTVTIDGLNITHSEGVAGRGIKIVDEDVAEKDALTTLSVANAKFVTEAKAAILVGSEGGAKITLSNIDLSGVKEDGFNAVWIDEDYKGISVEVEGGFCVTEGETQTEETIFVDGATVEVSGNLVIPEGKVKDLNNFTLIGVGEDATIQVSGLAFTGDNVKIKGLNIVNDGKSDCALSLSGKNPVVEDCVFTGAAGNGKGVVISGNGEDNVITLKNCDFSQDDFFKPIFDGWNGLDGGTLVIDGCTLANGLYTMHIDANGESGNIVIKNSTLNGFTTNGASLESISFENCTFGAAAGYACVNMYTSHSFTNCTFPTKADANNTGNYGLYVASNAKGDVMVMNDCKMSDGTPITAANMAVADGGFLHWDSDAAACVWTVNGQQLIATSAQLANAVAAMEGTEATFVLAKGTFALPTSLSGKTIVFEGANKEATIIDMTHGGTPQYGAKSVTFKNLTMKRQAEWIGGFAHSEAENYEDCIVEGTLVTYCPTVTATRTNFVPAAKEYYNVHLYSPGTMTFTDCNFTTTRGRSIYAHHDNNASEYDITINGCTFTTGEMSADDSQNQAAIRLHTEAGIHGTLTINNSTATGWKADHNGGLWVEWNNSTKKYTNNFVKDIDGMKMDKDGNVELTTTANLVWFANQVNVAKNAFTGKTVKLGANIDLAGIDWEPIGQTGATTFNGVFDGQNYTISNLSVDSEDQTGAHYSSGLFGWVESHTAGHGHIKNVNINGATIQGHHNCGALVGYITQETALVENCHVTGATVSCTYANGDADGDKAGALIGNATVATPVKDCTAAKSTVSSGRDAGQVIGAGREANVTGCSATEVTVTANGTGTGANIRNEVIGRLL